MAASETKKLIPSREVKARFGGVTDMTIYRWSHAKGSKFPAPIVIGRRKYWEEAAINDFIEAHRQRA